jgi:hypothetical protein
MPHRQYENLILFIAANLINFHHIRPKIGCEMISQPAKKAIKQGKGAKKARIV